MLKKQSNLVSNGVPTYKLVIAGIIDVGVTEIVGLNGVLFICDLVSY